MDPSWFRVEEDDRKSISDSRVDFNSSVIVDFVKSPEIDGGRKRRYPRGAYGKFELYPGLWFGGALPPLCQDKSGGACGSGIILAILSSSRKS
jgi:hypothetical protein